MKRAHPPKNDSPTNLEEYARGQRYGQDDRGARAWIGAGRDSAACLVGQCAPLEPEIQSRLSAGERPDLVLCVQRDRRTEGGGFAHRSHGGGVASSRFSFSFGAGGASRSATKASKRSESRRNSVRSSRASRAAWRAASSMNSERFLPSASAARVMRSRSSALTRRLTSDLRVRSAVRCSATPAPPGQRMTANGKDNRYTRQGRESTACTKDRRTVSHRMVPWHRS